MNTDPVTLAILAILVINTLLRLRTYRLEKARKIRAERRWMFVQSSINGKARS